MSARFETYKYTVGMRHAIIMSWITSLVLKSTLNSTLFRDPKLWDLSGLLTRGGKIAVWARPKSSMLLPTEKNANIPFNTVKIRFQFDQTARPKCRTARPDARPNKLVWIFVKPNFLTWPRLFPHLCCSHLLGRAKCLKYWEENG